MELYKKYPKVTTAWCCVEVVIYAGHLFGWSSLLYVLKSEGFYLNLCFKDVHTERVQSLGNSTNYESYVTADSAAYTVFSETSHPVAFYQNETVTDGTNGPLYTETDLSSPAGSLIGCTEQDTKLNLWFSIAIFASYFTCAFLGPLLQKTGVFLFRVIFICTFLFGYMCLALATPSLPWLICPGLCCVGISGMALYTTNIQTSFLFPTIQSTITSVFVGLFDASTIFTQLVKVAFENGYTRKSSYIVFVVLNLLLLGVNTIFFMPRIRLDPSRTTRAGKQESTARKEREIFINQRPRSSQSLTSTLLSAQYLLHIYWMSVQGVRFVTFLGFLNSWLTSKLHGNKQLESYYLSVFSYITLGTAISAITAGMLHDCQRKHFIGHTDYKRKRLPIVLPLVITTLLSIVTTTLTYVSMDTILYLVFILFTIYRSYLFSFEVTFINDVFPMEYFTVLFGILHSSSGLAGMLQFPLFKWYQAYEEAPVHVNLFFIVLEVTSLIHPLYIWLKCKRHVDKPNEFSLNHDLHVIS